MPYREFKLDFQTTPEKTEISCAEQFADLMALRLGVEMDDLGTVHGDTCERVFSILSVFIAVAKPEESPSAASIVHFRNGTTSTIREIIKAATAMGCTPDRIESQGDTSDVLPESHMSREAFGDGGNRPWKRRRQKPSNPTATRNPVPPRTLLTPTPVAPMHVRPPTQAVERIWDRPELYLTIPNTAGWHTKGHVERGLGEIMEIESDAFKPLLNVCSDNGSKVLSFVDLTVQNDGKSITLTNGRTIAMDAIVAALEKIGGSVELHNYRTDDTENNEVQDAAPDVSDVEDDPA